MTKGAHCRFDPGAARELAEFLRAVAAYAAGGLKALNCQIAANSDPLFASKNDPSDGAETGSAEPHIAERSRSRRAVIGGGEVMRGS